MGEMDRKTEFFRQRYYSLIEHEEWEESVRSRLIELHRQAVRETEDWFKEDEFGPELYMKWRNEPRLAK